MAVIADVTLRAPNSVLLLGDPQGLPPESMRGRVVANSRSCIAVGTISEADGEAHIRLAVPPNGSPHSHPEILGFEGSVELPNRLFVVSSVQGDTYAVLPVNAQSVRVRIWLDDATEPREIYVFVE